MKQFNLSEWLQDKSRKVVTRRGNPVRVICTDRKHGGDDLPIVFLEESNGGEFLLTCRNDGRCDNYDTQYDLFFADEEPQSIEIPFGAFDSEFVKDEYYIPDGCEARIEGNKVIIEKIQKNEDERIRKELIYFLVGKRIIGNDLEGIDIDKTLSWLEKQGEQKPSDKVEPKFKVGDWIRYRGENYNIEDIEITDDGFIYNVSIIGKASDPEEVKTSIGFRAEKEIIKIEQSAWNEEDEKMLNKIINELTPYGECPDYPSPEEQEYYYTRQEMIDWLKSLKPRWKPTEEQMKETLQTEYEKGRFDMREEMMKALVDGEVMKNLSNQLCVKSEPIKDTFGNLKFGDKVKIIIVKTE